MGNDYRADGYLNYRGELQVALSNEGHGYDRVLTRKQAEALRDQLTAALSTPDRVDTEAEAHARMTNAMNRGW